MTFINFSHACFLYRYASYPFIIHLFSLVHDCNECQLVIHSSDVDTNFFKCKMKQSNFFDHFSCCFYSQKILFKRDVTEAQCKFSPLRRFSSFGWFHLFIFGSILQRNTWSEHWCFYAWSRITKCLSNFFTPIVLFFIFSLTKNKQVSFDIVTYQQLFLEDIISLEKSNLSPNSFSVTSIILNTF